MTGQVSIVVPALNEEAKIRKCLESVLAQAEHVGEILVVDCGSTDGTVGIVEEVGQGLGAEDPPLRLLRSEERSYAAAVSLGVRHAVCPFVQLVDGDSSLEKGWLAAALGHLSDGEYAAARGLVSLDNPTRYGAVRKSNRRKVDLAFGGPHMFRAGVIKEFNYDPAIKRGSDVDVYLRMRADGHERLMVKTPMLTKHDADNSGLNLQKTFDQGFYLGVMLTERSASRGYVRHFVRLRWSYFLYSGFLASGLASWLFLPRLLALAYCAAPGLIGVLLQRGRVEAGLLMYADRMVRGGAFALGLLRRPGALPRILAGLPGRTAAGRR